MCCWIGADEESVTASSPSGAPLLGGFGLLCLSQLGGAKSCREEQRFLLRKAGSNLWGCSECEQLLPAGLGALGGGKTRGEVGKQRSGAVPGLEGHKRLLGEWGGAEQIVIKIPATM